MEFPYLINWTGLFPFELRLLGGIYILIDRSVSKQLRRSAASDQGLHCFPTFFIIFFTHFGLNYLPTIISIVG